MERKKQSGHLGRLCAVTISRVKTVRANILECLNSLKIVRLLIPTMMFVLSLTSVGVLLLGSPCLSSSAVIDYSLPYQRVGAVISGRSTSSSMTIVNDWRQIAPQRSIPSDVDVSSFNVSVSATDNYGTDFAVWVTIKDSANRTVYDSGWNVGGLNNESFAIQSDVSTLQLFMRIRYLDGQGTNPPPTNMFTSVQWQINFVQYVQTSEATALPPDWTVSTTAINTDIPVTALTTTTYINWDEQVTGNNGFFETLRYSVSTIFGIGDSWQSAVSVMNYMNSRLPYVFAISAFCGMVGIAVWFLEK